MDVLTTSSREQAQSSDAFSTAVGRGISVEEATELQNLLRNAQPLAIYSTGPHSCRGDLIYIMMEWEGWRERIKATADHWISVR